MVYFLGVNFTRNHQVNREDYTVKQNDNLFGFPANGFECGLGVLCRKWQGTPHSSRSVWVQLLKDQMRTNAPADTPDLDAETDRLGGSDDDDDYVPSFTTDGIPEDFEGQPKPPYDGSDSPISERTHISMMHTADEEVASDKAPQHKLEESSN